MTAPPTRRLPQARMLQPTHIQPLTRQNMTNTIISINPGMRAPAICLLLVAMTALPACARAPEPQIASSALTVVAEAAPQAATSELASNTRVGQLPTVLVHKSPTCGCCPAWVDHMRQAGFTVEGRRAEERRVG